MEFQDNKRMSSSKDMSSQLISRDKPTSEDSFEELDGEHKRLSSKGAALAIVSTIVGGGIVGIPYAFYYTGLGLGIALIVFMGLQTVSSVKIYLEAKDILPGKPQSLFEIGYMLYKRNSIFIISAIIIFNSFGLMMVYFIVFGDTLRSVAMDFSDGRITGDDFLGKRMAYVIFLAAALTPLVLKKQLNEISILSVLLFVAIFSFIILTIIQLSRHGIPAFNHDFEDQPVKFFYADYWKPKLEVDAIKAFSIIIVAFSCQQNLFPIYAELRTQTNHECAKSFGIASVLVGSLYVVLGSISVYMFGSDVHSSILEDVADECSINPITGAHQCPWESITLRMMFLIVVGCHVPFIFFSGKEGMLISIDEIDRRSVSKALETKIQYLKYAEKPEEFQMEMVELIKIDNLNLKESVEINP